MNESSSRERADALPSPEAGTLRGWNDNFPWKYPRAILILLNDMPQPPRFHAGMPKAFLFDPDRSKPHVFATESTLNHGAPQSQEILGDATLSYQVRKRPQELNDLVEAGPIERDNGFSLAPGIPQGHSGITPADYGGQ